MQTETERYDCIVIPSKSLRKMDDLIRRYKGRNVDTKFENELVVWAKNLIEECREEWNSLRKCTIDSLVKNNRRLEALRRGKCRDKRYAPFREYYKQVQYQKFVEYQKAGNNLTANSFAVWFLKNNSDKNIIPYKPTNQLSKLIQLAQRNNREFRSAIECKS